MDNISTGMLPIAILEILKRETDANHPMRQVDMVNILRDEYGFEKPHRHSVVRNIEKLRDELGFDIQENDKSQFWLNRNDFDVTELRLLADSILSNTYLSDEDKANLAYKVSLLGNKYFKSYMKNVISGDPTKKRFTNELYSNLCIVDEAITLGKKISFQHNIYGADKKLHRFRDYKTETDGYQIVSPYKIVYKRNRYYVICSEVWNNGLYDLKAYPLDRLTELDIMIEESIPLVLPDGFENEEDYYNHFLEIPDITGVSHEGVKIYRLYVSASALESVFMSFGNDVKVKMVSIEKMNELPRKLFGTVYEVLIKTNRSSILEYALDKARIVYVDDENINNALRKTYSVSLSLLDGEDI